MCRVTPRLFPATLSGCALLWLVTQGHLDAQSVSVSDDQVVMKYPDTVKVDVVDDYHGREIADPYRWLEDTESEQTAAWIAAQNEVTDACLQAIPERPAIRERIERLWNYARFGLPERHDSTYLYWYNDGLQNQNVLYKADSLDAQRQVLIDPNTLSDDGTVALAGYQATDDGKLLAYGLADGGSDWRTWRVRDIALSLIHI